MTLIFNYFVILVISSKSEYDMSYSNAFSRMYARRYLSVLFFSSPIYKERDAPASAPMNALMYFDFPLSLMTNALGAKIGD